MAGSAIIVTPKWLGRPILDEADAEGLGWDAAVHEFSHGLPRAEAEERAHRDYATARMREAAAHHRRGIEVARAAGDHEAAHKHSVMYGLAADALGFPAADAAPPEVQALIDAEPDKNYKFKTHKGDYFSLAAKGKVPKEEGPKPEPVEKSEKPTGIQKLVRWAEQRNLEKAAGRRPDIKAALADPAKRRELMVRVIMATQAREGVETSREQAEAAYDKVQGEKAAKPAKKAETDPGAKLKRKAAKKLMASELDPREPVAVGKAARQGARRNGVFPCWCEVYAHPHRIGGGKCGCTRQSCRHARPTKSSSDHS